MQPDFCTVDVIFPHISRRLFLFCSTVFNIISHMFLFWPHRGQLSNFLSRPQRWALITFLHTGLAFPFFLPHLPTDALFMPFFSLLYLLCLRLSFLLLFISSHSLWRLLRAQCRVLTAHIEASHCFFLCFLISSPLLCIFSTGDRVQTSCALLMLPPTKINASHIMTPCPFLCVLTLYASILIQKVPEKLTLS